MLLLACALLTACAGNKPAATSSSPSTSPSSTSARLFKPSEWITPFKPDVIQGNFISREQVQQLRPGMSRNDVRNVLGTPLVASIFHSDRWDYVFTIQRQGVPDQAYRYAVFFKGDVLERSEGDTMPAEADFIARLDTRRDLGKVPPLEATPEQIEAARKKSATDVPRATAAGVNAPVPAASPAATSTPADTTAYPPLESTRP